jgi:UDP-N-acetylmuramoyl-tripeptide--D-alanyl-D-alanine ligase
VLPQIIVKNTRIALGDIATLWSSAFTLPIVAITGSCGKTTVKEMSVAIFQQACPDGRILETKGNLNNDIGVPLTLLRLNKEHKVAVVELGANHAGEIKQLVNMVQPDVALITNVTHAHIEGFGSIEGVARAKAEIYTGLTDKGTAVINADDDFAEYWKSFCQDLAGQNARIKQLTYGLKVTGLKATGLKVTGLKATADISADYKQLSDGLELNIKTPVGEQKVHLRQFGKHNVYNALAATAVALSSGCTLEHIKEGLENFTTVSGRLEQKQGCHGAIIFDDTYNANPGSVRAGIDAIKQFASDSSNETILILGDMAELGKDSAQLHYQLGIDAEKMGITQLFTVGTMSQKTTNGFNSVHLGREEKQLSAMHFSDKNELIHKVKNNLHKGSIVLIKGSRSMAMESVVAALLAAADTDVDAKQKTQDDQ